MLRAAYPKGVPDGELPSLMAVMNDTGMSNRSVASAIAWYYGVEDHMDFLYQVQVCQLDDTVTPITKALVVDRLREHGYDEWSEED